MKYQIDRRMSSQSFKYTRFEKSVLKCRGWIILIGLAAFIVLKNS